MPVGKLENDMRFGWIPDLPDIRDLLMSSKLMKAGNVPLPPKVDLSVAFPDVYDQGNIGSCTAQAIASALDFCHQRAAGSRFNPSRLFIYYNERVIIGTASVDSGASIRDGIKSVNNIGACKETLWPYDGNDFKKEPSEACYQDALNYQSLSYYKIIHTNLNECKQCLANSYPFVFGVSIYDSFMSAEGTGVVPMPYLTDQLQGGHAMLCVGYDDEKQAFLVRNSWGEGWGMKGYCWMPYEYMTHRELAADFWAITSAE